MLDQNPSPPKAIEVVSVGILVADCTARPLLETPPKGRLSLVEHIGLYAGGSAASTGYGLARFGVSTAVIGRVGVDGFGDFLIAEAARHGAQNLLVRDPEANTSATLVTVDGEGERTFVHMIGANAKLTPDDVPLEELQARGAKLLHLAGFFALPSMEGKAGEPTRDLFRRAKALGFVTSLDCVWDAQHRWVQLIGGVLPETDIFCPSVHEARAITKLPSNASPHSIAAGLFDLGVRQVVVLKMGEEGSFLMVRDGKEFLTQHVGILDVPSIDGTGSGDAFIAGFLGAWLRGKTLHEAQFFGNAAGAMCVRALGAMTGISGWDELEAMAAKIST